MRKPIEEIVLCNSLEYCFISCLSGISHRSALAWTATATAVWRRSQAPNSVAWVRRHMDLNHKSSQFKWLFTVYCKVPLDKTKTLNLHYGSSQESHLISQVSFTLCLISALKLAFWLIMDALWGFGSVKLGGSAMQQREYLSFEMKRYSSLEGAGQTEKHSFDRMSGCVWDQTYEL